MGKSKRRKSQALPDTDLRLPTPQTLWRVGEASGQIETALLEMPNDIKRRLIGSSKLPDAISAARTPAQLVFLAKDVTGVFIPQWRERILAFGPEALPAIVRRLQSSQSISDAIERDSVVERLIGVMPMLGDSAAAALMSCFDSLDIYGQSLACMALGMMRVVEARDMIWRYFERVRDDDDIGYAVGAFNCSNMEIMQAIVRAAREQGPTLNQPEEFDSVPGHGVVAKVHGQRVLIGNKKLMEREKVAVEALEERAAQLFADGKTAMFVAVDGRAAGVVAVADAVRESAKRAVGLLHALGIETVMLTGDNRRTAKAVARQIGIDTVIAEVLPEDKAAKVKELQAQGRKVAMVGDGVNDAPALAQADVGIAIGAGTDVAVESAEVVLVKNDPADVAKAIQLARKVRGKIKQNLFWAAIYNVLAIPIAAGVLYNSYGLLLRPEWAALLMSASTVIVTLNALLLGVRSRPRELTKGVGA